MFKKFIITYDHRVAQKYIEKIKEILGSHSIEFVCVDDNGEANDYPLLAKRAFEVFKKEKADGMILLCGTGIGMNVVANKFDGIRSVLANSEAEAYFSRRHENANAIVFGAGYSDEIYEVKLCRRKMGRMLETFLVTDFEGGRHVRRLNQITEIENEVKK
ncbi:MAG: RpiB/LacA/LacB family sugar-phosphate isomerase [Clostridia bacterium]|nr:RpiB/LacA/LacB family sugar-phosphate isomerase [Clostridia bacterium]